ncbi:MAG: hypothetical protein U1F49_06170 [Rubrivivax sp.]
MTRYRAAGFDYVAIASDLGLLMRGALSAVQALRQGGDSAAHVHTLTEGTRTARRWAARPEPACGLAGRGPAGLWACRRAFRRAYGYFCKSPRAGRAST